MAPRTVISHSSSVAIIYRAGNPSQIFGEQKDEGHPDPSARGGFSFIGGNWSGDEATADSSPLDTLRREIREELAVPNQDENVREAEYLRKVIGSIVRELVPFASFLNVPPKEGTATHEEPALVNVFTRGLSTVPWELLEALQSKFGNLSTEFSSTIITSLKTMADGEIHAAFGNDRRLQSFWLGLGYDDAKRIPLTEDYVNLFVGPVHSSYEDLLAQYEVLNKPI